MGLRYDFRYLETFRNEANRLFFQTRNWHNASATANVSHQVNQAWSYNFNAGLAWRPPSINELYVNGLHHGTSSFEIGDPNMHNETGLKTGLQIQGWLADSLFLFEGYAYNQYIKNFIYLRPDTPATLTIRGAYPTFRYVQTDANLSGFDLKLTAGAKHKFRYTTMLSILYAWDLNQKTWIQQMPGNRATQEVSYHIPKTGKISTIKLSAQWISVFHQNRTGTGFVDYSPPPPTYHLLNISASATFKNWYAQIGINNAANTSYREYLNRFRYFNHELGRNIFFRLGYTF
jgi:iron complex outermembrane receptor protein